MDQRGLGLFAPFHDNGPHTFPLPLEPCCPTTRRHCARSRQIAQSSDPTIKRKIFRTDRRMMTTSRRSSASDLRTRMPAIHACRQGYAIEVLLPGHCLLFWVQDVTRRNNSRRSPGGCAARTWLERQVDPALHLDAGDPLPAKRIGMSCFELVLNKQSL